MANQVFADFAYDNVGDPIVGATVNLYDRNTTTPVRATTTTDANGYWTISHATEGRFDVEIVSGTTKRRRKYDAQVQLEAVEVAEAAHHGPRRHVPTDTRIEWLSLRLAADCARALGAVGRARELAERGVAAGGPKEVFAEHLG